jgi:hypothetical protein
MIKYDNVSIHEPFGPARHPPFRRPTPGEPDAIQLQNIFSQFSTPEKSGAIQSHDTAVRQSAAWFVADHFLRRHRRQGQLQFVFSFELASADGTKIIEKSGNARASGKGSCGEMSTKSAIC